MTISSISSHSNWSVWTNSSSQAGWRPHMKINLPIFKDEQSKDAVTYCTWWWDVAIHRRSGCRDWALLPHVYQSLQSFPRELARSLGKDATLQEVLWMLDEHYGVVMTFDVLNKELYMLHQGYQEGCLSMVYSLHGMSRSFKLSFQMHQRWASERSEAQSLLQRPQGGVAGNAGSQDGRWAASYLGWIDQSC